MPDLPNAFLRKGSSNAHLDRLRNSPFILALDPGEEVNSKQKSDESSTITQQFLGPFGTEDNDTVTMAKAGAVRLHHAQNKDQVQDKTNPSPCYVLTWRGSFSTRRATSAICTLTDSPVW